MEGVPVACGIVETQDSSFDRKAAENRYNVLVKVKAFSCNYRDKALIFTTMKKGVENSFYAVGSEFVGEVVEIGSGVTNLQVGDRVIGNNHYTGAGQSASGVAEGVPTNHASKEYQVLHQDKLIRIPSRMSAEVAAAFSIGAQTAYSMIRKLDVTEGVNVLVTSAKSNTSLFAINALKKYNANVYVTSTSTSFEKELKEMSVRELVQVDPGVKSFFQHERLSKIVAETGLFDCVFDPFCDLHLGRVIGIMAPGGRYVTCGLCNQYQSLIGQEFHYVGPSLQDILFFAIVKNLHIIGNCIGLTQDLEDALQDYAAGRFDIIVDSVFSGNQVANFFNRTYNARDRFGKVVYQYD